jgi:predicted flap endonuclease-1-like 5' DNA nuclease/uncharacterized membrane protein
MAIEDRGQTLAAFTVSDGKAARRLLENLQKVDAVDGNVELLDAAVVDRSKRGRIVVHQTHDKGALKGGAKGGGGGDLDGAIVLGPAGAVVGGAAGGVLNGIRNRIHDSGIDDKFMREVSKEIEKGRSALFVLYHGDWSGSIGMVERAITEEQALLFNSTLPADKAAALQALIVPATEELGGEEAVADYELEVEEEATPEETAAAEAEAPAEAPAEAAPAAAAAAAAPADDLTQLVGIGPKAAAALTAAGITTYAALATSNEPQLRAALLASGMMPPGSINTWPGQADYAARGDWQGLMKRNQKSRPAAAAAAAAAPAAAAAAPAQRDDLTQISGIGARLASILERGGVTSFQQLEQMSPDELREIIALGGALPPSSLASWPAQASYASRGDWSGLASYNRSR